MPQVGTIPNPSIQWTDGLGAATLPATMPALENWTPDSTPIGTSTSDLATGATHMFVYRTDYYVAFEMSRMPAVEVGLALRLKRWLRTGGTCTVNTQDVIQASYVCRIKPKGKVAITYDRKNVEYTLALELMNTVGTDCIAQYKTQLGQLYTIALTPTSISAQAPQSGVTPITAVVRDGNGNILSFPVSWSSTNPSVATVDGFGNVTIVAVGTATIVASAGGTTGTTVVTVTGNVTPASVVVTPSPLAFTATTYTGTPTPGISGVPAQLLTAVIENSGGQPIPYAAGALVWSSDTPSLPVTDNGDGTATVGPPTVGGVAAAHITCRETTTGVSTTVVVTTVASVMVAVVPSMPGITFTAAGQVATETFLTVSQYGEVVP